MIKLVLNVLLFVSLLAAVYSFILLSEGKRLSSKISEKIQGFNELYEKRLVKLRYRQYYSARHTGKRIIERLDILVEKTNFRKFIPVFSSEFVILLSVVLFTAAYIISFRMLYNAFVSVILGAFIAAVFFLTMKFAAYKNAEKVDSQLAYYTGTLRNFCSINDNIVIAIERSIPYLKEPLQSYNAAFINEVRHGIPIYDALENLKRKVDNQKFKMLVKSIQLCCKYKGSYLSVLGKFQDVLKKYARERSRRKSEIQKQRVSVYSMYMLYIVILFALIKINPGLPGELRRTAMGQVIVAFNFFTILFSLYKTLTLEQLKY